MHKTVRVWRVEDDQGRGPYNAMPYTKEQARLIEPMKKEHLGRNHPSPYIDDLLDILEEYHFSPKLVFGFPSEQLAREWFGHYMFGLEQVGFKLKCFEAKVFKIGKSCKQLVFYRP